MNTIASRRIAGAMITGLIMVGGFAGAEALTLAHPVELANYFTTHIHVSDPDHPFGAVPTPSRPKYGTDAATVDSLAAQGQNPFASFPQRSADRGASMAAAQLDAHTSEQRAILTGVQHTEVVEHAPDVFRQFNGNL